MAILEAYVAGDCRGITAASWICNFSCVLEYLIYGVIENDDDEGPEGPDWFAASLFVCLLVSMLFRLANKPTTNKGTVAPSRESTVDVRLKLGDSWPMLRILSRL